MLPEVTKDTIYRVTFPVFKLNSDEIQYFKGVTSCQGKVVDDINLPGENLGQRRVHIDKELRYKLDYCATDYITMLQANYRHFIDTKGKTFSYKKTKACKIKSYKIVSIKNADYFSLLKVRGLSKVFEIHRPPPAGYSWASVIFLGDFPWQILEFSEERLPDKKRLI